ncbi:MAG: hypothetical protein HY852_12305 [Bradyrhizobium sp.]|uniref:hypothetical protein n=1 Tax=Bradyrhizobium sp. TaxID=376 RepID=UPI0025BCB6F8|nr:hypothetical protein [Bradyrhizobium sp.]MBI5262586.1 hypothetical protein [Bradyrhizobium sp.]
MGLFVLDVVLWLLGVRGHIPQFGDFRPVPSETSANPSVLKRILTAFVAVFAVLSLAVWATVWLAIRLL